MTTEPHEIHKIVQDALKALKRGDRTTARGLAMSATRLAPDSEEPWLVLAAVSGPEESLDYIQKALQINPESVPAQHALEWALKQRADRPPAPEAEPPAAASERPTGPVARTERTSSPERNHRSHPQDVLPGEPHPGAPEAGQKKSSNLTTRRLLLSGLGLGILGCLALLALWFGRPLLGGLGQAAPALGPSAEAPAIFVPTPDCGLPTLVLGTATFQIKPLAAPADGSLPLAPGASEVAYWVEGTNTHRFFVLGPTPGTFSVLPEMTFENTASVTWSDCNSTNYNLSTPEAGSLTALAWPDQSAPGITVFFQSDAAGNGFALHGKLREE